MPDVAFIMAPGDPLRDLVPAIRTELGRQGMPTSLHESFPEPDLSRLFVLVSPRHYVDACGRASLPDHALLRRTLFLGAEAPQSVGELRRLYRPAGRVFDINQSTVSALHRVGTSARLLRPGHCPEWDRFDPAAERDIDVAFIGDETPRRVEMLAEAADVLARHRCAIHLGGPAACEVEGRLVLLARSKVVINLHAGAADQLDWLATVEAMHAGAVVVSEHATGLAPFEPGGHLLLAAGASLPWVVEAALNDGPRLQQVREQAYARLRDWLPFSTSVAVLRAALIEMLGRSLHHAPDGDDLDEADETHEPEHAISDALHLARAELADVRRQLGRLERTVRVRGTGDRPRTSPAKPGSSAAWAQTTPRVSVALPLDGSPVQVTRTLQALAGSVMRDYEIVAVMSGDAEAAEAGAAWLAVHDHMPWQLHDAGRRTHGGALNLALQHVRAPTTLLLSPGAAIYPRCLGALADALDEHPEAAVAYGIKAVRGRSEEFVASGGHYLMDGRDWDPSALCEGDPVGTPALLRTATLNELAGFAAGESLAGLECYDLWCRIAETGGTGLLVPEILSWIPIQEAAERVTAGAGLGAQAHLLIERAPTVLAGASFP